MNTKLLLKHRTAMILYLIIIIGAFLRFYNLDWGAPYYFHPDERNIASSVAQLHFPDQMHPHFFAYGALPIYIIYFTGILLHSVTQAPPVFHVPFETAIIISRFYSAFLSLLLIPLLFSLGKKLKDTTTGLIAAALTSLSIGLIQYAHFGTFEVWLTFFSVLLFATCLAFLKNHSLKIVIFLGIVSGILFAIKVSSLILFPLVLLTLFTPELRQLKNNGKAEYLHHFVRIIRNSCAVLLLAGIIYCATNPFVILDPSGFLSSMRYESGVALGTIPVFYTGEFFTAPPLFFHMFSVYPFLLTPLLALFAGIGVIGLSYQSVKKKQTAIVLLLFFFYALFLTQTFLFVKWTRYVVPTLPFLYLILALFLTTFRVHAKQSRVKYRLSLFCLILLLSITSIFTCAFLITAYVQPDTRLLAVSWARKNIPAQAEIASEVYDLGITPFNQYFPNITLVNTYDLDTNHDSFFQKNEQKKMLSKTYIILPSQRILKTRIRNPKQFPNSAKVYQMLISGTAGYKKVYETPCDIACKIAYLGNPVFHFEETATVFDRPTIFIFQKL